MATNPELGLEIIEYDEANKITATYVQSRNNSQDKASSRIDKIEPKNTKPWWDTWVLEVFLPTGYPHSVTDDYTEYQIYDSLQAFASSIVSLISSRAVLASVGVGDASASATNAVIYSVIEESFGRLATILFAHRFGTSLEPECKMYRLLADVLNDLGFILNCLSPLFPKPYRILILGTSGVLRSLCGVAAGSAKASLSAHFAKQGNLGELNAKDSSQETVISLAGMLVGAWIVPYVQGQFWTWSALFFLLAIHLEMNRRAVRAVRMNSVNRQRATVMYHQLGSKMTPTPTGVSLAESIFEWDGILRNSTGTKTGHCTLGDSIPRLLESVAILRQATHGVDLKRDVLEEVIDLFRDKAYLIWFRKARKQHQFEYHVIFKKGATNVDAIEAWWQTLEIAQSRGEDFKALVSATWTGACSTADWERVVTIFRKSGQHSASLLQRYREDLRTNGWDLEIAAMETSPKVRISLGGEGKT